jgi:uncharacterized membrane protein YfcA
VSPLHAIAIFAAGIVAGTINTVVGSGTLFTFPVLLGFGYPPVVANVSNTVGLVPGSASGALGYRRELAGQRGRVLTLATASIIGGVIGAVLLLSLPASAFKAIVPAFIAVALVLIVLQPRLSRLLAEHRPDGRERPGPIVLLGVLLGGVYGGYFGAAQGIMVLAIGAAQGIMVLAILSVSLNDKLQRLNAVKVILTGLVNLVSGIIFIFAAHVAWGAASLIAGGSLIGGVLGSRYGRRLSPTALRGIVVVVGITAIVRLLA